MGSCGLLYDGCFDNLLLSFVVLLSKLSLCSLWENIILVRKVTLRNKYAY
ncbi:hypothetical protein Fmac_013889 [Flemingia macrophylla]|uniref:Uncharacterized protein n=1 Tax=Flemingia macrophylla TaxID=520843 RepID=A0ABD1MA67_9FABA